jgi:hypothetical protein
MSDKPGLTTVGDLIDLLSTYPRDTLVAYQDTDYDMCRLATVDETDIIQPHQVHYSCGPSNRQVGRRVLILGG